MLKEIIKKLKLEKKECYGCCNTNNDIPKCSIDTGAPECDCGVEDFNKGIDKAINVINKFKNK